MRFPWKNFGILTLAYALGAFVNEMPDGAATIGTGIIAGVIMYYFAQYVMRTN